MIALRLTSHSSCIAPGDGDVDMVQLSHLLKLTMPQIPKLLASCCCYIDLWGLL